MINKLVFILLIQPNVKKKKKNPQNNTSTKVYIFKLSP